MGLMLTLHVRSLSGWASRLNLAAVSVHEESAISKIEELSGKKVGTGTSTTFELYLQKDLSIDAEGAPTFDYLIDDSEIKSYETSSVALDDLRLGDGVRLDGVVSRVIRS